jgi:hypothetical protein
MRIAQEKHAGLLRLFFEDIPIDLIAQHITAYIFYKRRVQLKDIRSVFYFMELVVHRRLNQYAFSIHCKSMGRDGNPAHNPCDCDNFLRFHLPAI